jgi:hypothetical protein
MPRNLVAGESRSVQEAVQATGCVRCRENERENPFRTAARTRSEQMKTRVIVSSEAPEQRWLTVANPPRMPSNGNHPVLIFSLKAAASVIAHPFTGLLVDA